MDKPEYSDKKSDAEVEMLEQFQQVRLQNELIKSQRDRLQKLLDEITCSNDSQRICECGRKLRYISAQLQNNEKTCTKCSKPLCKISKVWWTCQDCNYYACAQCQGYKKSVCPFSHFLQYKQFNADIEKQEQEEPQIKQISIRSRTKSKLQKECDICLQKIEGNYYVCTCGFDMCKPCRNKP